MRQVLSEVFSSPSLVTCPNENSTFERRRLGRLEGAIDKLGREITFPRNFELFGEGEFPGVLYKMLTGAVRAYKVLNDGRRQILEFYYPGDIFGFDTSLKYAFSAEAVIGSSVFAIKRSHLISLASHDVELGIELWQLMTSDLERARDHLMMLGCKGAQEKVMDFLSKIARDARGERLAYLPMSRADVADHLGLTIETVSRVLTQLEKNLYIKFLSSRLILVQKSAVSIDRSAAISEVEKMQERLVTGC